MVSVYQSGVAPIVLVVLRGKKTDHTEGTGRMKKTGRSMKKTGRTEGKKRFRVPKKDRTKNKVMVFIFSYVTIKCTLNKKMVLVTTIKNLTAFISNSTNGSTGPQLYVRHLHISAIVQLLIHSV